MWADDEISEAEFLGAIEYLIGEGVIAIPEDSDSRKYMTKEYKFSVWQSGNWGRRMQTRDPGLDLVENALVEHGALTSDVPTKIKVGIMEMKGSSLEGHAESITDLLEERSGEIGDITFTEFEGTVLGGRDTV